MGETTDLRFLIGADQVKAFHRWHEYKRILELASPVVMLREPLGTRAALEDALIETEAWTTSERTAWLEFVASMPVVKISATDVRSSLATGVQPDPGALSPAVERFIREHGLYRSPETNT